MTTDYDLPTELDQRIQSIIKKCPESERVFQELLELLHPTRKKRKVEIVDTGSKLCTVSDLSIIHPLRKKINLVLYKNALEIQDKGEIALHLLYSDICDVFTFKTPNKSKAHYTMAFIPKESETALSDQAVLIGWDAQQKLKIEQSLYRLDAKSTHSRMMDLIKKATGLQVGMMSDSHIDCHYKAKDGHLFITEKAIFFGLKKPLFYFKRDEIEQINIVGVTGRTFNIVIQMKDEFTEFSMIDMSEYDRLADFIQSFHGNVEVNHEEVVLNPNAEQYNEEEDHDFESDDSSDAVDEEFDSDTRSVDSVSIHTESEKSKEDEEEDLDIVASDDEEKQPVIHRKEITNRQNEAAESDEVDDDVELVELDEEIDLEGSEVDMDENPFVAAKDDEIDELE